MWGLEPIGTGAWVMMKIVSCEGTIEEPEQDRGAVHCYPSQQHPRDLITRTPGGSGFIGVSVLATKSRREPHRYRGRQPEWTALAVLQFFWLLPEPPGTVSFGSKVKERIGAMV